MSPRTRLTLLSDLGEFGLIQQVRQRFQRTGSSVLQGIGDDSAVLKPTPGFRLLVTTDLLTEGVHFDLEFESFIDVGYRAAVANLSDIAAMGGIPQYLLVALAIPRSISPGHIHKLYEGLMNPCKKFGVALIGGDTSLANSHLSVTLTVLGHVEPHCTLYRKGAKVGDQIYVTGTIGDSRAGLHLLQSRTRKKDALPFTKAERGLLARHLRPIPRIELARVLAKKRLATASIDISDGFSGDLHHLCAASKVGATLVAESLPLSPELRAFIKHRRLSALDFAMAGGEDYELLFTAPPGHHRTLSRLAKSMNTFITCVGEVKPKKFGVRLKLPEGKYRQILPKSYEHFRL